MTRIIMCGCNGAMGRMITGIVNEDAEAEIVAGIDMVDTKEHCYPVFQKLADCDVEADALIDFSTPKILDDILTFSKEKKVPVVLCTTGYDDEQLAKIEEAATQTAVLKSANMSLGINLMVELCKIATKVFANHGDNFDIEVIEKHHNQKLDAPSGTALMIADGISSVSPTEKQYVYDRHAYRKKRDKNEIGIHSIRGGTIVGEHEVIFAGHDEVVSIKHEAHSKEVFAIGSINAAVFMKDKKSGMYDMSDLLAE